MTSKVIWASIFGVGTAAGGGATLMLPESLWADAQTLVVYKKGDEANDNTFLKIGGDKDTTQSVVGTMNSESLIRIGDQELEHQSLSYWKGTQNNSLWLGGDTYLKSSGNWQKGLSKKVERDSSKGSLSLYFLNIDCNNLMNDVELKKEKLKKGMSLSCEFQDKKLFQVEGEVENTIKTK